MKTLFFAMAFYSSFAHAKPGCEKMRIKVIYDKKPIITEEVLCIKKAAGNLIFYISESCVNNGCEILTRDKAPLSIKDYTSRIGSPSFKLCTELGGTPQIFEYTNIKMKEEWRSTERCLFNQKDFVETPLLTHEWKSFINLK